MKPLAALLLFCASGQVSSALAFDHQALQMTDLAESAAFYTDVLRLQEVPERGRVGE